MFDPVLLLLSAYSKLYYFWKHRLHGGNLPGFGILSRWTSRDSIFTAEGARLVFDHRAAANYACLFGGYFNEPETHTFINRVIDGTPSPVGFIDVGANIGEMVVDFPRHLKVTQALAFEPSALCASIIERSCALNGLRQVRVVTKAVGDTVGSGLMPRDARFQNGTAVQTTHSPAAAVADALDLVPVTTLDVELPDPSGLWIVLIDVEGGELAVMRGGRQFVRQVCPLIVFEYHEETRTHFSLGEVRAELGPDYELFRLRSDGRVDRDLREMWNCVAVSSASPFYGVVGCLNAQTPGERTDRPAPSPIAVNK